MNLHLRIERHGQEKQCLVGLAASRRGVADTTDKVLPARFREFAEAVK